MSEDSESEIESQQKRKISKLKDSSNNEDNEDDNDDDDSDFDVSKKKRKLIKLEDSPEYSSSSSDIIASSSSISARRFRVKPVIEDSDSDNSTDSSSSFEFRHKTNRLPRIKSDAESDSSNSVVIRNRRRPPPRVFSDDNDNNSDGSSQWNTDVSDEEISNKSTDRILLDFDSDSSNDQTEKCPICLISLNKNQEIGIPEICEHMFCAECIQEWSKSMNTCPVDRQPYNLIFVRKNLHGIVYREIEIEPPNQQLQQPEEEVDIDVVYEDATFCEICGRCDREERMLLCDGCDLGYHLECLTPPLDEIPGGTWYCSSCVIDEDYQPIQNNRTRINRLIPRTRHSERVRHRIRNNRTLAEFATTSTISSNENNRTPPIVTSTTRNYRDNQPKRATTKKKRRKRPRYYYKTTYQIDEKTGETVLIKKRIKKRRRKSKKARQNRDNVQKTVKGRLASQLGICAPRMIAQILPEMRVQRPNDTNIIASRQQAGVPTLHLFGQRNELDYFPQSDNESDNEILSNTGGGPNVLIRRPPNRNDIVAFRRRNRIKNISIPDQVSTTTNVLDNILDMQTKFYSKETIFNIDKNGKFTMKNKNDNNNNNNNHVNFNDYNQAVRQRTASCSNNNRNNDSVPSSSRHDDNYQNNTNNSTPTSTVDTSITNSNNTAGNNNDNNQAQDSSSSSLQRNLGHFNTVVDERRKDRKTKNSDISENNSTRSNTPYSGDSEIDIYSDIETVSTSKVDDNDIKQQSPIQLQQQDHTNDDDDDDDNDSESDMIIDTDKTNLESEDNAKEETAVTSTVDNNSDRISMNTVTSLAHSTTEIQSEAVQSSNQRDSYMEKDDDDNEQDDDDSEDGCPNFSIYSKESQNLAKNIDISIPTDSNQTEQTNQVGEISSSPAVETVILSNVSEPIENTDNTTKIEIKKPINSGLYSDSEDETVVKKNINSFALNDIRNMTEDISEEERSYTPCLDEREPIQQGIEGLDTEMISDEDRNDFDESHDIKAETDGEALEINAKESELDFTRPEECEEGEIVDKTKIKKTEDVDDVKNELKQEIDNSDDKENDSQSKEPVFKKLSKNNKERNYRDKDKEKDRSRSRSKDRKTKNDKDIKKEKKKEKRKEMERYNVRAVVAERPKRCLKDRFGRDLRCSISRSKSRSISLEKSPSRNRRSSSKTRRSLTPPPPSISSRNRRSPSREYTITTTRKKQTQQQRGRSRTRRSRSHSSTERKRSRSKTKKRKRSSSYERSRRRKSRDRSKTKKTKRSRSRHRTSRSITPKRRKDWTRRHSREWSPSLSRSRSPEPRHLTPSWTPPRLMDNTVKPHKLTVILTNDSNKKKKDKKRKAEKKTKENDKQKKKKRSDRTPPPSKEVFASGDNILVSVSFNKENETRDVSTKKKKEPEEIVKKIRKDKRPKCIKPMKKRDLSDVKPVAIIDLERSPFKELTPSPKDIIVLSDSDNDTNIQKNICDSSSQQVVSPEHCCGPKTPPEPQVKFTLTAKVPQLRNISNPLHEPDDIEPQTDNQQVDGLHKGPNTPPEPPNSPPSSPDAYDPFEPTKSRSPSPEPLQKNQTNNVLNIDNNRDNSLETRSNINEIIDKSNNSINPTPDVLQSHTPPLADVQPADSQSSIHETPESNIGKSPECLNQNQSLQIQPTNFSITTTKSNVQTTFSTVPTSVITSTPINTNTSSSSNRINLLNTTILTTSNSTTTTTLQNRNILSNTIKSSPIKISPNKPSTITTNTTTSTTLSSSSSSSSSLNTRKPNNNRNQNNGGSSSNNNNNNNESTNDNSINLDSPYSPGSSDYEGLFEPPVESPIKTKPPTNPINNNNNNNNTNNNNSNNNVGNKTVKSPARLQSAFDALFGSPMNKMIKPKANEKSSNSNSNNKFNNNNKKSLPSLQSQPSLPPPLTTSSSSSIGCKIKASKQVGIKFDEDSLKILDELPSSAVEMQVKDKFLKKLNRQERVVEEVKLVLKPHYNKKHINKEEYKDILRRAVPKICHNKSGEINPTKIKNLIEAYVKKIRHSKKVTSSSSVNPQKA